MAERFRRTLFGGGARSSDGYVVLFNSRSSIEYRDAVGKVIVSAEGLATPRTLALHAECMWCDSQEGALMDDEARRIQIIERLRKAASFCGLNLV